MQDKTEARAELKKLSGKTVELEFECGDTRLRIVGELGSTDIQAGVIGAAAFSFPLDALVSVDPNNPKRPLVRVIEE